MANYGIHFMVDFVAVSGRVRSDCAVAQFSCDDQGWATEAKTVYEAMTKNVGNAARAAGEKVAKIYPPNIIKLGND